MFAGSDLSQGSPFDLTDPFFGKAYLLPDLLKRENGVLVESETKGNDFSFSAGQIRQGFLKTPF